jgi:D-alanyl-D-alanine carboxypeptidase
MPLGLGATRVNNYSTIIEDRVTGYSQDQDGRLRNADRTNPTRLFGSASIASSAGDLAKWGASLASGRLLKPASLLEMWTPARLKDGTSTQFGFGWFINQTQQGTVVQHSGGATGFRSHIVRFARDGMTVAVLANSDQSNAATLAENVHRILSTLPVVGIRQ